MKKNVMMRVASVLLVAVMLTTCVISGTFAKYVTSGEGTDSARVAKFGVTVTANGETFTTSEDGTVAGVSAKTVLSGDGDVVAPGMSGDMASMTLAGTPEVAVRVTYSADVEISDNWLEATTGTSLFYFPIIITINGVAYSAEGTKCTTADAFEEYLEAKIAEYSKDYAANTDLGSDAVKAESLNITWEWPFSTGAENDAKDTILGNAAAAGNAGSISITVTTTVTQID